MYISTADISKMVKGITTDIKYDVAKGLSIQTFRSELGRFRRSLRNGVRPNILAFSLKLYRQIIYTGSAQRRGMSKAGITCHQSIV